MISIGAVIGGPECEFFDKSLRTFMTYCKEHRPTDSDNAKVNIVFHLPGSIIKPDYVGVRTAKFSRKDKTLMIQVAVEIELINSKDETEVLQYLFDTSVQALDLAKLTFEKKNIDYDIDTDKQFLDKWHISQ